MAKAITKTDKKKEEAKVVLIKASARSLRVSPRKMRLVTNLVKKMSPVDALVQLRFVDKKSAPMVSKLIKSAIANADHNFGIRAEDLRIVSLTCDMGQVMKRSFPRARGSAFVIRRKLSSVNIVLEGKLVAGTGKQEKKKSLRAKEVEQVSDVVGGSDQVQVKTKGLSGSSIKQTKVTTKRRLFNRKSA